MNSPDDLAPNPVTQRDLPRRQRHFHVWLGKSDFSANHLLPPALSPRLELRGPHAEPLLAEPGLQLWGGRGWRGAGIPKPNPGPGLHRPGLRSGAPGSGYPGGALEQALTEKQSYRLQVLDTSGGGEALDTPGGGERQPGSLKTLGQNTHRPPLLSGHC